MTTSAPSYSTGEYAGEDDEWFTPPDIIEKAREALGGIDLDPASHAIAQATVRAKTFFTAADNGLDRPWSGRVWLNPPFNRTLLSLFAEKLVAEYASGAVEQAILLTYDYTDVGWFHAAARAAQVICFPSGRIHFLAPSGEENSPRQGQALFYFGRDDVAFRRTFADVGLVMTASEEAPLLGERQAAFVDAPKKSDIESAVEIFGPVEVCVMRMRRLILEVMSLMPGEQWPELITTMRDQLDDLAEGRP